jgi:hypothetical protein
MGHQNDTKDYPGHLRWASIAADSASAFHSSGFSTARDLSRKHVHQVKASRARDKYDYHVRYRHEHEKRSPTQHPRRHLATTKPQRQCRRLGAAQNSRATAATPAGV